MSCDFCHPSPLLHPSQSLQRRRHFCQNFFPARSALTNPSLLRGTYCPHGACDMSQKRPCFIVRVFHERRDLGLHSGSTSSELCVLSRSLNLSFFVCKLPPFRAAVRTPGDNACKCSTYCMILISHSANIHQVLTMSLYYAFLVKSEGCLGLC